MKRIANGDTHAACRQRMTAAASITDQDQRTFPYRRDKHIGADETEPALRLDGEYERLAQPVGKCRDDVPAMIGWWLVRMDRMIEQHAGEAAADLISQHWSRLGHKDVSEAGRRQGLGIDKVTRDFR